MAVMMYREAVLSTIAEEMARDPNVVVLGEDVVGGMGTAGGPEAIGGIWSTSTGLFGQFGAERVIDTPLDGSGSGVSYTVIRKRVDSGSCATAPMPLVSAQYIGRM